jgi:hypothetical protein
LGNLYEDMRKNRKQYIGDIDNSNVIIINGDVFVDEKVYSDIKYLLTDILRKDFEKYSSESIEKAKSEIDKFLSALFDRLTKEQNEKHEQLIERFSSPAIQENLHNSILGYITNEDEIIKDLIIEVLVDRLIIDERSTEKLVINEAINVISKLNRSTACLISLMSLRRQALIPQFSIMLESYFLQLTPLIDNSKLINKIDIEIITHLNCTNTIKGLFALETFEKHLLKRYDLFFRHKGNLGDLEKFKEMHHEITYSVNEQGTRMYFVYPDGTWNFIDVNSKLFYNRLQERNQSYLIPVVEELKNMLHVFTENEVREYLYNINVNWKHVIKLLNSEDLRSLDLSILGIYIGCKLLSKIFKYQPFTISDVLNSIDL